MRIREVVLVLVLGMLVVFTSTYSILGNGSHTTTITSSTNSTETITTTAVSTMTITPFVYNPGLELRLSDNATTLFVGQDIFVNVSLFNSLPSVNSVPTSKDYPFEGVPVALWPVCYLSPAVYAVVLMGNYTLQSMPSVANVDFGVGCQEAVTVDHAVFQPNSIQANITGRYSVSNENQTLGPFQLAVNFTTSGYWNLVADAHQGNTPFLSNPPSSSQQPDAIPFTPGVYTIAVADEWGQTAILHFVVQAQ